MKPHLDLSKEEHQMEALLKQASEILKGTSDLNTQKEKLENLFEEIMYWKKEENNKYEEQYNQFFKMLEAMCKLDFSKRISVDTIKTFPNFIAVGLNMVNEELEESVLPKKMIRALIEAMDLKNTILVITDPNGLITFLHSDIDEPYFSEEALLGQGINVFFQEDFQSIDSRLKKEGTLKSMQVNMTYNAVGPVTLRSALPTMVNSFEGLAYVITIPNKK
jgi:hypothetical protein